MDFTSPRGPLARAWGWATAHPLASSLLALALTLAALSVILYLVYGGRDFTITGPM